MHLDLVHMLTVPLFTAVIGYVTNWTGVLMLFYPLQFRGVRVPGLSRIAGRFPRKVQQVPGIMNGGLGWQGIIPSRAAKMGSIAVDKGIAKLGSPAEFYEKLEPEAIAEHILESSRGEIRDLVENLLATENPQLWYAMPERVRDAVHDRVQQQLPDIVRTVTDEIGRNIDQLLDVKLMVIHRIEEHPELANRIFLDVGKRELRIIQYAGFVFGLILGVPLAFVTEIWHHWWILPIGGVLIGYITNLVAIWMIFKPTDEHKVGPFRFQGLFIKRQDEVADVYAGIIADDVVNLSNIGDELLNGPRSDRTRQMIADALRPAVDRAVGPARPLVEVAFGRKEFEAVRSGVATHAVEHTMQPLTDPEFNRRQSAHIQTMIAERMRELASADFAEMLRSGMRQDEWLLYLHGAVLGFAGGLLHLAIFGV
jgi:uncharacterized membrane protein YheB (UPF0754 family)